MRSIGLVTLVVREYDEAIDFFVRKLGFDLIEDSPQERNKRWVVVSPSHAGGSALLLARADGDEQSAAVGRQTGGRVAFFLYTSDFDADYQRMLGAGVRFVEAPRSEPYGKVVVFEDLYGNRWDLLERKS